MPGVLQSWYLPVNARSVALLPTHAELLGRQILLAVGFGHSETLAAPGARTRIGPRAIMFRAPRSSSPFRRCLSHPSALAEVCSSRWLWACPPILRGKAAAGAKLRLGDRTCTVDHGAPRFGKHSLGRIGRRQRLAARRRRSDDLAAWSCRSSLATRSSHPATTRLKLRRNADDEFLLRVEGAAEALGAEHGSAWLPGTLGEAKKNAVTLALDFVSPSTEELEAPAVDSELEIRFGPHRVGVPFTAWQAWAGAQAARLRAARVQGAGGGVRRNESTQANRFRFCRCARARKPGSREPRFFNLVVEEKRVRLIPVMPAEPGAVSVSLWSSIASGSGRVTSSGATSRSRPKTLGSHAGSDQEAGAVGDGSSAVRGLAKSR